MKDKFIEKANKKFNNRFDYTRVKYVNAKAKVNIGCPDHGYFYQTPDKHLQSKYACPICNDNSRVKRHVKSDHTKPCITKEDFSNRFYQVHNEDAYELDLSDFKGMTKGPIFVMCKSHNTVKIYTCPKNSLITEFPCEKCSNKARSLSKTKSYEDTINECIELHRGKYYYPEDNKHLYKNRKSIIKIVCDKHGEFEKKVQKHLAGQGCFRCRIDKLIEEGVLLGGYSNKYFEDNPEKKDKKAVLYYMKIGDYYKVGITTNLNNREKSLRSKSSLPVEIIWSKPTTLLDAYQKEQYILNKFKDFRVYLGWSTEVFSEDVLKGTLF